MKIYGQIEGASLENLTTDPTAAVSGRIYINTTTGRPMLDDGTAKRALFRNDGKFVFGTDTTPANNVRFHHAGPGMLQFVPGADTTAENVVSTSLAQVGLRVTNLAADPAVGNPGRIFFNTTSSVFKLDNGANLLQFSTTTGPETLSNKTVDVLAYSEQATPSTPASGIKLYSKAGGLYKLSSDGIEAAVGGAGTVVYQAVSTATTLTTTPDVVGVVATAGAFQLTLPTAVGITGKIYRIVCLNTSGNAITVKPNGSETISGLPTVKLYVQNDYIEIISNGVNWTIIDSTFQINATYSLSTNTAFGQFAVIKMDNRVRDNTGLYNPATGVALITMPGQYRISVTGITTTGSVGFYALANGGNVGHLGNCANDAVRSGTISFYALANTSVTLNNSQSGTLSGPINTNGVQLTFTQFTIERTGN